MDLPPPPEGFLPPPPDLGSLPPPPVLPGGEDPVSPRSRSYSSSSSSSDSGSGPTSPRVPLPDAALPPPPPLDLLDVAPPMVPVSPAQFMMAPPPLLGDMLPPPPPNAFATPVDPAKFNYQRAAITPPPGSGDSSVSSPIAAAIEKSTSRASASSPTPHTPTSGALPLLSSTPPAAGSPAALYSPAGSTGTPRERPRTGSVAFGGGATGEDGDVNTGKLDSFWLPSPFFEYDYEQVYRRDYQIPNSPSIIPVFDVTLTPEPAWSRTEWRPAVEEGMFPHVDQAVRALADDWYVIHHMNAGASSQSPHPDGISNQQRKGYEHQLYGEEAAAADRYGGGATTAGPEVYSSNNTPDDLKANAAARAKNRRGIYHLMMPQWAQPPERAQLCAPDTNAPLMVTHAVQFSVEFTQVNTEVTLLEPAFCAVCIFDMEQRKRVSADFHFDLNRTAQMTVATGGQRFEPSELKRHTRALFALHDLNPNLYLVVRIQRLLLGDLDKDFEAYTKSGKAQDKAKDHLKQAIMEMPAAAREFHQALAWSAIPVCDERGQLALQTGPMYMEGWYRDRGGMSDGQLVDCLVDLFGPKKKSKERAMPGSVQMNVTVMTPTQLPSPLLDAHLRPTVHLPSPAHTDVAFGPNGSGQYWQDQILEIPALPHHTPNAQQGGGRYVDLAVHNMLYIQLGKVNLSNAKANFNVRNISVKIELKGNDDPSAPGLRGVRGPGLRFASTHTSGVSTVAYHEKAPCFQDMFMIELPTRLTAKHHLLFTFSHVTVRPLKKNEATSMAAAYAIMPLCSASGQLLLPEHPPATAAGTNETPEAWNMSLRLCSQLRPRYLEREVYAKLDWIDGPANVCSIHAQAVSSFYTEHKAIVEMFAVPTNATGQQMLANALDGITALPRGAVLQFFPIIINQLLYTIRSQSQLVPSKGAVLNQAAPFDTPGRVIPGKIAVDAMLSLVAACAIVDEEARVNVASRHPCLLHFASRISRDPHSHAAVCAAMMGALRKLRKDEKEAAAAAAAETPASPTSAGAPPTAPVPGTVTRKVFNTFAWFSLALIQRSLTMRLAYEEALMQPLHGGRFGGADAGLWHALRALVLGLVAEVVEISKQPRLASQLNTDIARFVCELLAIYDRDRALELIQDCLIVYTDTKQNIGRMSFNFKTDFLRTVFQFEHLVPLSLPAQSPREAAASMVDGNAPFTMEDVSRAICQRHYLPTVLVTHVIRFGLTSNDVDQRWQAIELLCDVLAQHEHDPRYDSVEGQHAVASVFFPLVLLCIEEFDIIKSWTKANGCKTAEQRQFLSTLLYVLRNLKKEFVRDWLAAETGPRIQTISSLLEWCVNSYEHEPAIKLPLRKGPVGFANQRTTITSDMVNPAASSGAAPKEKDAAGASGAGAEDKGAAGRAQTLVRRDSTMKQGGGEGGGGLMSMTMRPGRKDTISGGGAEIETLSSLNQGDLCAEGQLIIVDFAMVLLDVVMAGTSRATVESCGGAIFSILTAMLGKKQSVQVYNLLYPIIRRAVVILRAEVFHIERTYCTDLATAAVSQLMMANDIRVQAIGFIYFMLKQSYLEKGDYRQFASQATIALSSLVAEKGLKEGDTRLYSALDDIISYASKDKDMTKNFVNDLRTLNARLTEVIRDTLAIWKLQTEGAKDPELLADLYYGIIESHRVDPELRVTWMKGLIKLHEAQDNQIEVGVIWLHIAATVADALLCADYPGFRWDYFTLQEAIPACQPLLPQHVMGLAGSSKQFTPEGLALMLRLCTVHCDRALAHEISYRANMLLIPILNKNRDYRKLKSTMDALSACMQNIVNHNASPGTRVLGAYYRVGFYGAAFGNVNGTEFVYKEVGFTHLYALTERLEKMYKSNVGGALEIIKDSAPVDRAALDPAKAYIQITSVTPYLTNEELAARGSDDFALQYQLSRFEFVTPFTRGGKAQGSTADQWKRRTILTVRDAFPHLLKRSQVVSKDEIEVSPIDNAIEAIRGRTDKLQEEIRLRNPKRLQSTLQGSVLLQVNKGSIEICESFLLPAQAAAWQPEQISRLKESLRGFLAACQEGLKVNRSLIQPDQQVFQQTMEDGYRDLKKEMEQYVG